MVQRPSGIMGTRRNSSKGRRGRGEKEHPAAGHVWPNIPVMTTEGGGGPGVWMMHVGLGKKEGKRREKLGGLTNRSRQRLHEWHLARRCDAALVAHRGWAPEKKKANVKATQNEKKKKGKGGWARGRQVRVRYLPFGASAPESSQNNKLEHRVASDGTKKGWP